MNRINTVGLGFVLSATIVGLAALLASIPAWGLLLCLALTAAWLATTRLGRQTGSVTWVGIATLPRRLGSAMVVVMGIAGVVGVLVALLAMGSGFERTLKQTGSDDTVLILNAGAQSEAGSTLDNETLSILSQIPQVLKDGEDRPLLSAERLLSTPLPRKGSTQESFISLRGVGEQVWELWPRIIVTGRKFQPGLRELVAGKNAQQKFAGLEIGSTLKLNGQPWTVVGSFDSGDAHNSELWGDAQTIASAYRLDNRNSLTLRLTDAGAFDAFKAAVASDPRLKVDVHTTRQYYNLRSEAFAKLIRIVGAAIGALMAVGAVFGALNATYTAVASRGREIATLRALGFRGVPVIGSVLIETLLLAAVGGAIGAWVAWALFDGYMASTSATSGSQVVFAFNVSPQLLWDGLKWALVIGFAGGVFPAVRAARQPITTGLREL